MNLKETQDRTYELLCLIDDICREEGVTYYLEGGTEIGAVREKDLIPWDDDIDIKIRRSEYAKFKAAMEKHLPPYIRLVEPKDFSPLFFDFISRVVDTRYQLRKEKDEDRAYGNLQNSVCVDILEYFHVPESAMGKKISRARMMLRYGLAMGHRYHLDYSKYSPVQKIAVGTMSLAGKLVPARKYCEWFAKELDRLERKQAKSADLYSNWILGTVYPKDEWYRGTADGEIRGRKFPVPVGYDADLRSIYGDYMKPPKDLHEYNQHLDPEEQFKGEMKVDQDRQDGED